LILIDIGTYSRKRGDGKNDLRSRKKKVNMEKKNSLSRAFTKSVMWDLGEEKQRMNKKKREKKSCA